MYGIVTQKKTSKQCIPKKKSNKNHTKSTTIKSRHPKENVEWNNNKNIYQDAHVHHAKCTHKRKKKKPQ